MNMKDMNETVEIISKLIELKEKLKLQYETCRKEEDEECDDCDDETEEEDELCEQLGKEYESIMIWCFGKKFNRMTREKTIVKWKERHPKLPVPRSLMVTKLNPIIQTVALLIDVIPLYIARQKED